MVRLLLGCLAALGFCSVGLCQTVIQPSTTNQAPASKPLDGITFASFPGRLYVSAREVAKALGSELSEPVGGTGAQFQGHPVAASPRLFDGSLLIPVSDLRGWGAALDWNEASQIATVQLKNSVVHIHRGSKLVVIDKSRQSLMAYQGGTLVIGTHVSTGREGHGTPNGNFTAGPAKEPMHRSRLYHFAPMPWSVQVQGNVFIHGYTSVPRSPASHGCIRMPLNHGNPAHYFYNWVDIGTPVTIQGVWHKIPTGHRIRSRVTWRKGRRVVRWRGRKVFRRGVSTWRPTHRWHPRRKISHHWQKRHWKWKRRSVHTTPSVKISASVHSATWDRMASFCKFTPVSGCREVGKATKITLRRDIAGKPAIPVGSRVPPCELTNQIVACTGRNMAASFWARRCYVSSA